MMDETESLRERVAAVERAVSGGETDLDALGDAAAVDARLAELESTVAALETRVADLDAAVQAVRGFAGGVRAVDRGIERRADLALAKAEALESELADDGLSVERATADGDGALERAAVGSDRERRGPSDRRNGSPDAGGADDGEAARDIGGAGDVDTENVGAGTGDADRRRDAESAPLVERLRDRL